MGVLESLLESPDDSESPDEGPGIDPQDLTRLFERYHQTTMGRSMAGGTGLGLFIVKSLVEAHAGTVGVENAPGGGTCFRSRPAARQSGVSAKFADACA
jgi:two-component system OmpR family sensor kinase